MTAEFGAYSEDERAKTEALYSLVDIEGKPAGLHIVSTILNTPSIRNVFIFGEPGANKSTVMGQLVREVVVLSKMKIAPTIVLFDEVVKDCMEEFGHHTTWNGQVWTEVSRRLQERVETPSADIYSHRREVKFIEVVAVHKEGAARDRGAKALKYFAEAARKNSAANHPPESIFIAVVADSRSQKQTGEIREATLKAFDEEVVEMWQERFGVTAEGLQGIPPKEAGRILKFLVGRMAKAVDILRTRTEMYEAAVGYLVGLEPEKRQRLLSYIRVPSSTQKMSRRQCREYVLKAIHMRHYVYEQLQLDSSVAFVVFSPFKKRSIYWPADMFVSQVK
ncbi:MAG: hypothetical protein HYW33_01045 [Candidatus Blackburnbacteria bacterium]|nr:hypothetical protein [Candidatus Blackburnbacteria bacterium]